MFDPRKPTSKNRDIYDETRYDKQYIQNAKIKPMVQVVRTQLCKAIVKCFLHMSDYVWKKRHDVRNYMLDMYMWLCPISLQYMLYPKHSHRRYWRASCARQEADQQTWVPRSTTGAHQCDSTCTLSVACGFPGLGPWSSLVQGHCFVTKLTKAYYQA
jgi:hypothetical protein